MGRTLHWGCHGTCMYPAQVYVPEMPMLLYSGEQLFLRIHLLTRSCVKAR